MAYSERIKDFERIRDYMRAFYVYGFKSRGAYDAKSARSYDNERRRIESWLGDFMAFRTNAAGKNVFLSVDSREIPRNPLYKAFQTKSFTNKDITLHFYILDILADGEAHAFQTIVDRINDRYLARFERTFSLDESTVRKKLKEYEQLGLLSSEKRGRAVFYRRTDGHPFNLASWADALAFYAEENPIGVIGSFLLDRLADGRDVFRFKHHYILHALDSDVLCRLLLAMDAQRKVDLTIRRLGRSDDVHRTVCPLKIYLSTQTGRQYLLGSREQGLNFIRLDAIRKVEIGDRDPEYADHLRRQADLDRHLWGVSTGTTGQLEHVELTVRVEPGEDFIVRRLEREKRHGVVQRLDDRTYRFVADVYDAAELLPWLRTFIGRIVAFQCSNRAVEETFNADLKGMYALYRRDAHAVP